MTTNQSNKTAITSVPIDQNIATRWSPRAFDPDATVDQNQIVSLLEAARWAPSCFGDEPWRFIVLDRAGDPERWQNGFDCLMEGNQIWVKNAPVIIIVVASSNFRHNGKPNRWAQYDTGAAAMNLCLQATALGLVSHQMGGFRAAELKESFSIPDGFETMAMIALGKPGDVSLLPPELQEKEEADRTRLQLEDIAFHGHWGRTQDG